MASTRSDVWYRNPLVWLMIALPGWSVVAGISTVVLAFQVFDGVVVDDYYARGKAINVSLERDLAAQRRGLAAIVSLSPSAAGEPIAGPAIAVTMSALDVAALPPTLRLAFLHATHGGADAQADLLRTPDGTYRGSLPRLAAGKYYLQIEAEDWRLVGTIRQPGETTASLGPAQ